METITKVHPVFYILTFAMLIVSAAILNKTIMKNELNITITEWGLSIDNSLNEEYTRKKQEYLRKYKLKEIKTNRTKTALEQWN
jgi:hypothetical protein